MQDRLLVGLLGLGFAATVFAMPYQSILPVFARDILDVSAGGLGWLIAMGGIGALGGALLVASFTSEGQLKTFMAVGVVGFSVLVIAFALSTVYLLSLLLLLVVGLLFQMFMTASFTIVQLVCPDHIRGRVVSIRMIIVGMGPVGMVLLGVAAEVFSPALATAAMAAIALVLVAGVFVFVPSLLRARE